MFQLLYETFPLLSLRCLHQKKSVQTIVHAERFSKTKQTGRVKGEDTDGGSEEKK